MALSLRAYCFSPSDAFGVFGTCGHAPAKLSYVVRPRISVSPLLRMASSYWPISLSKLWPTKLMSLFGPEVYPSRDVHSVKTILRIAGVLLPSSTDVEEQQPKSTTGSAGSSAQARVQRVAYRSEEHTSELQSHSFI